MRKVTEQYGEEDCLSNNTTMNYSTTVFTYLLNRSNTYIKVHMATRWTIRHSLMLLWFADLMNVTEEVTIHRPNVLTLLSSAFISCDLNAATRGPFIWSLISQEANHHRHNLKERGQS